VNSLSQQEAEDLAGIYKALGNKTRILLLQQISEDSPVSELTHEDMTRSALQKHVEKLIDTGLVYRPVESGKTYELTKLGRQCLQGINDDTETLLATLQEFEETLEQLQDERKEVRSQMEEAGISTEELDNKLKAEAWEKIREE
jgi:DNA-binding transcriptional ArsR family regulator